MLVFDWHLDLAWNALEWDRDLTLPIAEIRRREVAAKRVGPGRGSNTVSFPALRQGNVAVVSATLLARHDRVPPPFPDLPKSGFGAAEASSASSGTARRSTTTSPVGKRTSDRLDNGPTIRPPSA